MGWGHAWAQGVRGGLTCPALSFPTLFPSDRALTAPEARLASSANNLTSVLPAHTPSGLGFQAHTATCAFLNVLLCELRFTPRESQQPSLGFLRQGLSLAWSPSSRRGWASVVHLSLPLLLLRPRAGILSSPHLICLYDVHYGN